MIKDKPEVAERFHSKYQKCSIDGCWEWTAAIATSGYGVLSVGNYPRYAHRLSWELHNKKKIKDGLFVLHRCDNRKCVNPAHLFVGTHRENMHDMIRKGRARHTGQPGEENHFAKLNRKQVDRIRDLYSRGKSQYVIAARFDITQAAVSLIVRGKTWQ